MSWYTFKFQRLLDRRLQTKIAKVFNASVWLSLKQAGTCAAQRLETKKNCKRLKNKKLFEVVRAWSGVENQ